MTFDYRDREKLFKLSLWPITRPFLGEAEMATKKKTTLAQREEYSRRHFVEGMSVKAIAKKLGVNPSMPPQWAAFKAWKAKSKTSSTILKKDTTKPLEARVDALEAELAALKRRLLSE
jgi:hypothetical protein